jgi:signal transduction histidine kinase
MADRVEQIGGALEIEAAPGAGTVVRVTVPGNPPMLPAWASLRTESTMNRTSTGTS